MLNGSDNTVVSTANRFKRPLACRSSTSACSGANAATFSKPLRKLFAAGLAHKGEEFVQSKRTLVFI